MINQTFDDDDERKKKEDDEYYRQLELEIYYEELENDDY